MRATRPRQMMAPLPEPIGNSFSVTLAESPHSSMTSPSIVMSPAAVTQLIEYSTTWASPSTVTSHVCFAKRSAQALSP